MSEHDINLVTAKAGSTVVENLKVTLATPAAALTPATFTAMIGIAQGSALTIAKPVQDAMAKLANIASSNSSANVNAAAALSSLSSFQSSMGFGGTPNHAAFGSFLNQAQGHIQDSIEVRKATDFMANMKYSDFGAGITDLGSSVDRGMSAALGSLPDAGAMMASTGTMFKGVDTKDFGSSVGTVKALLDNKLATVTGVKRRLSAAGVPLADIDNPIYKEKIDQVMGTITDPGAMSVVADQFDVAPEIAAGESSGDSTTDTIMSELQSIIERTNAVTDDIRSHWIPDTNNVSTWDEYNELKANWPISTTNIEYSAVFKDANQISLDKIKPLPNNDFKLALVNYRNNDVEAALADANAAIRELKGKIAGIKAMLESQGPNPSGSSTPASAPSIVTVGTSIPSTAMGADLSPGQTLPIGAGGIQSLKDLGDPAKLNPGATAAVSGGVTGLTTQLSDLGAGFIKNPSAAPGLFSMIQSVQTPLTAANPNFSDLGTMIKSHQSTIDSMTGSGSGPLGLPSMTNFTEHLAGGPSITNFLKTVDTDPSTAISALNTSVSGAQSLWATAGVDLTTPAPNSLGTAMAFAQNLHKFGADTSGSGIGDILHNLANTATAYGEGIKASLAEGKNAKLLSDNAIPPITTTPPPPAADAAIVNYPITVSRRVDRPAPLNGYMTIEAVASSSTDEVWRLINGDETYIQKSGREISPYQVWWTGTYDAGYGATKELAAEHGSTSVAAAALPIWPQLRAELDSQKSGGSPKALG